MLKQILTRLTYANVMSTVAVFGVLAGGTAWAATSVIGTSDIQDGAVTAPKLHANAVTSLKVADLSLRLHDLGGLGKASTAVTNISTIVPDGGCALFGLATYNPAPKGLVGSLVVGYLTDAHGHAVLSNSAAVVPTMVSESTQGGVSPDLMVCEQGGGAETIPAGSVIHYRVIGP